MGAWGYQFDENDDAADWLGEFEDQPRWAAVQDALRVALDSEYLEAPDVSNALAALEVIAAAKGRPSPRLPEAVQSWAKANSDGAASMPTDALAVIVTVRDGSELAELWDESEEGADWRSMLDELENRLNQ